MATNALGASEGVRLAGEIFGRRLYLRNEKDEIVRERNNLQDATRCLVNGISRLTTKPAPVRFVEPREHYGERSWMA